MLTVKYYYSVPAFTVQAGHFEPYFLASFYYSILTLAPAFWRRLWHSHSCDCQHEYDSLEYEGGRRHAIRRASSLISRVLFPAINAAAPVQRQYDKGRPFVLPQLDEGR